MIRYCLLRLIRSVWLANAVIGAASPADADGLLDRLIDAGRPGSVTIQGPFAGFIATPQVIDEDPVTAFVIAPNRQWFAAYSKDCGVRIMDMQTGAILRMLRTDGGALTDLSISQDGQIVEAVDERSQRLGWNAATGEKLSRAFLDASLYRLEYPSIHKIDHLKEDRTAEAGDQGTFLSPISGFLKNHGLTEQFPNPTNVGRIIKSPDGHYALIFGMTPDQETDEDGTIYDLVKIWDLTHSSVSLIVRIPSEWAGVSLSAFAFDGRYLVLGKDAGSSDADTTHVDSAGFELKNNKLQLLWRNDSERPDRSASEVSADARFYSISDTPNGPVRVWDINQARLAAIFDPTGGAPVISSDGDTFAAVEGPDEKRKCPAILVLRHGKRMRLGDSKIAAPSNESPFRNLTLSPDGRYLAAEVDEADSVGKQRTKQYVALWDINTARQTERLSSPDDHYREWEIASVSNDGRILLLTDKSAFKSGKWVEASKDEKSVVVPYTTAFTPVCGVVFCDRVARDLGVVVRLLPNSDDEVVNRTVVDVANFRGDLSKQSPDGRFIIGRLAGDKQETNAGSRGGPLVVDIATGRTLLTTPMMGAFGFAGFTSDSRNVIESEGSETSFSLRDIASGKKIWTLQGTPDLGFVMVFANGRLRVSPGAEKYVKLVKDFEVKPYDDAARRLFEQPVSRAPRWRGLPNGLK